MSNSQYYSPGIQRCVLMLNDGRIIDVQVTDISISTGAFGSFPPTIEINGILPVPTIDEHFARLARDNPIRVYEREEPSIGYIPERNFTNGMADRYQSTRISDKRSCGNCMFPNTYRDTTCSRCGAQL